MIAFVALPQIRNPLTFSVAVVFVKCALQNSRFKQREQKTGRHTSNVSVVMPLLRRTQQVTKAARLVQNVCFIHNETP